MIVRRINDILARRDAWVLSEAFDWIHARPEHLVFRADKTVSMTVPGNPAEDNAAPAAPETKGPAPVTGKYQIMQVGKVGIQLMNGNNYTTTISLDLIGDRRSDDVRAGAGSSGQRRGHATAAAKISRRRIGAQAGSIA